MAGSKRLAQINADRIISLAEPEIDAHIRRRPFIELDPQTCARSRMNMCELRSMRFRCRCQLSEYNKSEQPVSSDIPPVFRFGIIQRFSCIATKIEAPPRTFIG